MHALISKIGLTVLVLVMVQGNDSTSTKKKTTID